MFLYLYLWKQYGNSANNILKLNNMNTLTFAQAYDILINLGVSEETINTVLDINGSTFEQLENILYATQGYNSFSQLD